MSLREPIFVVANATDSDGIVDRVDFLVNGLAVGTDTNIADGWTASWSPETQGFYSLEAIATDNDGLMSTSAPVTITVLAPFTLTNLALTHPTNLIFSGIAYSNPISLKYTLGAAESLGPVTTWTLYSNAAQTVPSNTVQSLQFNAPRGPSGSPLGDGERFYRVISEPE